MYKKNIVLLAIMISSVCAYADYPASSGYPANQGYQADGHHHHKHHHGNINPQDQKTINDIDVQLAELNEATRDPYHKVELAYLAGFVGAGILVLGLHDKHLQTALTGGAITALAVGGGMLASNGDQKRLEQKEKFKRDLMDRKEKILAAYRK